MILCSRVLSLENECDHFLITEDHVKLSKSEWDDSGAGWEIQVQREEDGFAKALIDQQKSFGSADETEKWGGGSDKPPSG